MNRVTDRFIIAKVKRMQDAGMCIALDGQYGRWRVTTADEQKNLSPRASNREIADWLEAYEMGWEDGRVRGVSDMRHGREVIGGG